jgi:RNA polymerase sigma-70 factor (ECF subfamily)
LTSIVFLESWRRRAEVRLHGPSVLPWLLAVANNCLRNTRRSFRRHRALLAKLPEARGARDFEEDIDQRIDDERRMRALLTSLERLRAEEYEVIALCDWAALTYDEAATTLDIPVGTVRSRLSRAHEHVRELERAGNTTETKTSIRNKGEDNVAT